MINEESVKFIENTPAGFRVYSVRKYAPHYHKNALELLFVLKGQVQLHSSYDSFTLAKGDFTVINNEDVHCIMGDEENLVVSIYLDLETLSEKNEYIGYLYFICESFNVNSEQKKYTAEMRKLMTEVLLEAVKKDVDADKINDYTERIINILMTKFDLVHYHDGSEIPQNQMERYYRIIREVELRYGEKLSIEELANKEYIGKNYISQFWKKITGMNFTEYLNSRRIEKAESMLFTTGKSIYEISLCCGFSDSKYIYKNFKKWYGKTPAEHKKQYEKYLEYGIDIDEYDNSDIIGKFGRVLAYANMDDERASVIKSAANGVDWKFNYETQMNRYLGCRLKTEIIRERHQDIGIREIHLPLLDKSVAKFADGQVTIDENVVLDILRKAEPMFSAINIEVDFESRTSDEWEAIIRKFVDMVEKADRKLIQHCRFTFYFSNFEMDTAVKKLTEALSDVIGAKNMKIALRFDH